MPDPSDPLGYLLTEARIISEDDIYAVLAVRIEKDWIARNMPFLTALSDLLSTKCSAKMSD